jgi:DNA-binding SARP family transcriptional activator
MAGDEGLRIGVLGPLTGTRNGAEVGLPRGRAGVLLAVLAMSAGNPVGAGRLAELIWPEEQPQRVRASLHSLVARLRGAVPDAIVTAANGYLLNVGPDQVDLLRFRQLVGAADGASEPDAARGLLDQALGLWRGDPVEDLRSAALDRDLVPGLIDERLSAVQRRADLDLAAGRYDRVVAELRGLTTQYPLREPLWGQLIRALAGAGRAAEAIQQYLRAREILADELGVDPSPGLQDLYRQLLQADRPGAAAEGAPGQAAEARPALGRAEPAGRAGRAGRGPGLPRQLPAGVAGFAGRSGPLKVLSEQADEAVADPGIVVISAVGGMAGVGKTALAVHWAHQEAGKFPGGQLYADLRGFDPSGVPACPVEVIRGFLDALGVPAERIPPSVEAQAGLYRTLLAGRRVLIVLDNARDAAQVRPLLPGSPGCMVVVTSRTPLTALAAAHGARLIRLDVLTDAEAAELLTARLGTARVAAEQETAAELVALCGRLPLALAITAARAAARPGLPLAVVAAELRDVRQRLDALDAGDAASNLRAVFSWSCQALSDEAIGLFRLLSIHPGPDISLPAAESLAGPLVGPVGPAMAEMAALHLVTEHRPGRYALHNLVRAYAAEQARASIPVSQRRAVIHRALDHYVHCARDADAKLSPHHHPITFPLPGDRMAPERFDSRQQALDWFDAEYQVLLSVTALAVSTGFDTHAWQLPATFVRYLDRHGYWHDWAAVQRTALAAAQRIGDKNAQAGVFRNTGLLCLRLGSYEEARGHYTQSLDLYRDLGDQVGQARAHGDLSMAFAIQDHYREALTHSERAVDLSRSAGHPHVHAVMLNKVGWHAAHLGDYQRALGCCQQALDLLRELGNRYSEAFVWDSLGYIHQHLRDHGQSIDCFRRAVSLFREIGNRFELAATLSNLGDACRDAGQPAAARDAWQQALAILDDLHHPDVVGIRAKLRDHGIRDSVTTVS